MAYTLKALAKLIQPGQLGLNQAKTLLLFCPFSAYNPQVKFMAHNTNWHPVPSRKDVLHATATLENFYVLEETRLKFEPTLRVQEWLNDMESLSLDPKSSASDQIQSSILFDWQRDGAKFLFSRNRAMLSLSPGLGKTLTSAYAAGLRNFNNILVVCPASLLYYWKGELEKWAKNLPKQPIPVVCHQKKISFDAFDHVQQLWVITNPETAVKYAKDYAQMPFDAMIVDESIMYKHRESNRSQAMKDLAKNFETVWFLTGAPATKNLDDMWHQFHILKPAGYPSYWRFTRSYCLVEDDEWGSKVIGNRIGAENKIKKNFADIYFSRTQDDVANIPDWIMEDVDIPMHPAQDKAYDILRNELYIRLESVDPGQIITVGNHLSLMIRSVQVASNPLLVGGVDSAAKWDALPELMKIYPGPYIIWVNFIETGRMIRDKLGGMGMKTALANGSTSMEDRNKMVDAFQREELDAIILNNQVGKFGFTLTKGRTAFFVERMYDDSYFQCLHRNRRIGTVQSPVIVNMRSVTRQGDETIDHLIHDTLDYRVGMIKRVTAADLKKVFSSGKRKPKSDNEILMGEIGKDLGNLIG